MGLRSNHAARWVALWLAVVVGWGADVLAREIADAELAQMRLGAAERWLDRHLIPYRFNTTYDDEGAKTSHGRPPSGALSVASFDLPPQHPAYRFLATYKRSYLPHNALAAIALTIQGRRRDAAGILKTLQHLQNPDGSVPFSWNCAGDNYSAGTSLKTGPICLAGLVATFYERQTGSSTFRSMALQVARWVVAQQVHDPEDKRFGLVRAGIGRWDPIRRRMMPEQKEFCATTDNVPAYFFLRDLARLSQDAKLLRAADRIRIGLLELPWNEKEGSFNIAVDVCGVNQDKLLSASALGAVFLAATGEPDKAQRCLAFINANLLTQDGGCKPFLAPFAEYRNVTAGHLKGLVYAEGSLQTALACQRQGRGDDAARTLGAVAALQVQSGGVRTVPRPLPDVDEYLDVPCAGDTCWVVVTLRAKEASKLFDPSTERELSLPAPPAPSDVFRPRSDDPLEASLERALHWIDGHLVRASHVPEWPQMLMRTYDDLGRVTVRAAKPPADCMAIRSFDLSPAHSAYESMGRYGRSTLYDNSIATVVLVMAGKPKEARGILTTLQYLQNKDGSLGYSLNTGDSYYAADGYVKTGALCWSGYAAVYYQLRTGDRQFQPMAVRIGDWVLKHQINDVDDPRNGLVTGGYGRYQKGVLVHERTTWTCLEHQVDAYSFIKDLARATGRMRYSTAADTIKDAVLKRLWCEEEGRFYAGVNLEEGTDKARALDCASWGAIFALAVGEQDKARRCLEYAEKHYATTSKDGTVRGYRPYDGVIGDYARQIPDWGQVRTVWSEGSWGVACAALKLGDRAKAKAIAMEMLKMQVGSGRVRAPFRGPVGGVYYVTDEMPDFLACPSAAGTCWQAMVLLSLREQEHLDSFWGQEARPRHLNR